ncbi:MAG: hypothetical protein M3Y07_01930 [Acidobacteriota bacterium]|nr:hypothetical protein [Acidobacteriota bacterium]
MIAFKDRTLDSALFAWIEDDALRYLNLQDACRIVPLKRIDWKATKNLNPSWDQPAILHLAK